MHKYLAPSTLLVVIACAPSVQDCRSILPVASEPVTLTTTPVGTPGCSCLSDGVLVVAEARRTGFSWSRGALWIDGISVGEQDFSSKLAEAKTRKQIEAAAAQAQGAAKGVRDQIRNAGKALTDLLKH